MANPIKNAKDRIRASLFEIAQKRRELPYKEAAQSYYDDEEKAAQERVVVKSMGGSSQAPGNSNSFQSR